LRPWPQVRARRGPPAGPRAQLQKDRLGRRHPIEHGDKRLEVARAQGREEGFNDLPLTGEICAGWRRASAQLPPRTARELTGRHRRAPGDAANLVRGHSEHVVKHEREPDDVWNEAAQHFDEPSLAALVINIALVNFWNRVNVSTRLIARSGCGRPGRGRPATPHPAVR
jgi:hypothetical protein